MDAIEKQTRAMLAHVFACAPGELSKEEVRAARAVLAYQTALAPPDGYVLVNHTQLRQLLRDVVTAADFVGGRGQSKPLARRLADQAWALIEAPGVATRPEVPS
ncbi:hypothetical protein [Stenotrophomonas sp. TD3]|uniref:hypothetical protein n=1 Tax=Stenotrophomonas sp. TD3 TaxID=1641707 RepID=UPI000950DA32|nr:hypothetical protein [Stenotrophomonas sp. TD3]